MTVTKGAPLLQSSQNCWGPGTLERSPPCPFPFSDSQRGHSSCDVTNPSPQEPKAATKPSSAAHCTVVLLTRAWFSRVQLVVSRLVTARPVPGVSAQKTPSALVPATVPVWVTEVPASAWDYGDACVQRPYDLEENCEAGFPNLQMGKVRPRQGLPKAQDFSARGALWFLDPTGDPLQPTPATFLQR